MAALRVITRKWCLGQSSSLLLANEAWKPMTGAATAAYARRTIFYLPTILRPAFWRSLVPTFLRRDASRSSDTKKPWNPATFYIWMALLIGSQSIQQISLQRGFEQFTRETDQKLELLREVVGRIQNGEDVDVEKMLGTGDPRKEKEWAEVMREIEEEDALFQSKRQQQKEQQDHKGKSNAQGG